MKENYRGCLKVSGTELWRFKYKLEEREQGVHNELHKIFGYGEKK